MDENCTHRTSTWKGKGPPNHHSQLQVSTRKGGECTHRALHRKRRETPPTTGPEANYSPEWRGIVPRGPTARNGNRPSFTTASQLHPNGPLPGLARDHAPHKRQRRAVGRNDQELHRHGPPPKLARGDPIHQRQKQASARFGGELQPQGILRKMARYHPTDGSSNNFQGRPRTAKPSAKIAEGPPHRGGSKTPARNAGDPHPRGPPPGLPRDCHNNCNSRPHPGMAHHRTQAHTSQAPARMSGSQRRGQHACKSLQPGTVG